MKKILFKSIVIAIILTGTYSFAYAGAGMCLAPRLIISRELLVRSVWSLSPEEGFIFNKTVEIKAKIDRLKEIAGEIEKYERRDNDWTHLLAYLYKLEFLTEIGVFNADSVLFYPFEGRDFFPTAFVKTVGLTKDLGDIYGQIEFFRERFYGEGIFSWEGVKDHVDELRKFTLSLKSSSIGAVENIDSDFYAVDEYLAQLKKTGINTVIIKGLAYFAFMYRESLSAKLGREEITAEDVERELKIVFRQIDEILPEGSSIVFFEYSPIKNRKNYLYEFMKDRFGYYDLLDRIVPQEIRSVLKQQVPLRGLLYEDITGAPEYLSVNGNLSVLRKPLSGRRIDEVSKNSSNGVNFLIAASSVESMI